MYLTAIWAPFVASGPISCSPPCWLIQPIVTGGSEEFAGPCFPSVYVKKLVTPWPEAAPVAGAGAAVELELAAAADEALELELVELLLEPHAPSMTAAAKTAAKAINRA